MLAPVESSALETQNGQIPGEIFSYYVNYITGFSKSQVFFYELLKFGVVVYNIQSEDCNFVHFTHKPTVFSKKNRLHPKVNIAYLCVYANIILFYAA